MKLARNITLLLLFSFSSSLLYAQLQGQAKIDSLLKELPSQKEDTNKVKVLNNLAHGYYEIAPDEGIKYGQMGLDLATKLHWKKGIANANHYIGYDYQVKSDYPKSMHYFLIALKLYEEIGNKQSMAYITNGIGNNYMLEGDYLNALEYNFKNLKLNEELKNSEGIAAVTCNIGSVYLYLDNYPKALEYYFKALTLDEKGGFKRYAANVTSCIGTVYKYQKDYLKSMEYYTKSSAMYEKLEDEKSIIMTISNIGGLYIEQKNYRMAAEYLQRSLKLSEEHGIRYSMVEILLSIAKTYLSIIEDTSSNKNKITEADKTAAGNDKPTFSIPRDKSVLLKNAIDYLDRGLAISKEMEMLAQMKEYYKAYSDAYRLKGDYKKALEFQIKYQTINDSIFSADSKSNIVKLEMKDQYDRQRLTDSLKTQAREKVAAIQLQKQKIYTFLGIAGILLLTGFSFFIFKERSKSENERKKSDSLLLNILPAEVAQELKAKGSSEAKKFVDVTVIFTDFVNFTGTSATLSPEVVVQELNDCFSAFDAIIEKNGLEKIKTIGDAYLAVCGLPVSDHRHAQKSVQAAIEIKNYIAERKLKERTFDIRIGINSGPVVAGIVGVKKFAYDIWGDTVNVASRMEQSSETGKINISNSTYELVKNEFTCEYRGEIDAKGKGTMKMYYVE